MAKEMANGVWPVMITPFKEDMSIDYDGVLKIIEWYDKMGVDGIFAVCQSSEMFELSAKERLELAKFVVDNTPKHIGVIASGHCAESVEDQIKEAQAIIETGVDVPNANTLIIENADRMGLSQLHQLRGRVGRSPRRAYAYFCFTPNKQLSDIASKRLEAIREYTEFGSGFKIAMRDLEIRGAGSILGGEQHGNMESVGYDMYLKLLSQAVNEENGIVPEDDIPCTVDLNVSAHIPESYIESLPARLGIYKRIAAIRSDMDASDVIDELCDRFGEPPKAVMGLIDIAILRNKAADNKIAEITSNGNTAILHINSIEPAVMHKLADKYQNRFLLKAGDKPLYTIKLLKNQSMTDFVTELISAL